jgi:hypothetical protein
VGVGAVSNNGAAGGAMCAGGAAALGGGGRVELARLGQDGEPLVRLLFGGQLPVVFENDRRRVARLKRHLVCAFHLGDPVADV